MIRSAREFGTLIRENRKALGWTQTELAARSGTGERFIVELESGKPSCQLEKALIVARTVGPWTRRPQIGTTIAAATRGRRTGIPADLR